MGLFKKKCMYCREKIDKGSEMFGDVKVPGYVGTFNKPFCDKAHLAKYKEEINNRSKNGGGSCCG